MNAFADHLRDHPAHPDLVRASVRDAVTTAQPPAGHLLLLAAALLEEASRLHREQIASCQECQHLPADKPCDNHRAVAAAQDAHRILLPALPATATPPPLHDPDRLLPLSCPRCGSGRVEQHERRSTYRWLLGTDPATGLVVTADGALHDIEHTGRYCFQCGHDWDPGTDPALITLTAWRHHDATSQTTR